MLDAALRMSEWLDWQTNLMGLDKECSGIRVQQCGVMLLLRQRHLAEAWLGKRTTRFDTISVTFSVSLTGNSKTL